MKALFTTLLLAAALSTQADNNIADNHSKLLLDTTVVITNVKDVWAGQQEGRESLPQAFTGKNVVAGLVDIGLDPTHPMFRYADGKSRVKWYWDMTKDSDDEHFGTIYDTPEKVLAAGPSESAQGVPHGTHVAGIMAGSEFHGIRGVAYEADLMMAEYREFVYDNPLKLLVEELKEAFPDKPLLVQRLQKKEMKDLSFLLGLKRIFDQADALGQPCVINMSYGSRDVWLYASNMAQEIIDELVKTPGHIIVAGAGNDGLQDAYREKKAGEPLHISVDAKSLTVLLRWKRSEDCPILTISNGSKTTQVTFDKLMTAIGSWTPEASDGDVLQLEDSEGAEPVTLTYMDQLATNDDMVVMLSCSFSHGGQYTLSCESQGALQVQSVFEPFTEVDPLSKGLHLGTIARPACFESMIAVGAMHYRSHAKTADGSLISPMPLASTPGTLASLSSCGPSLDRLVKPDVAAPGHNIISAMPGCCMDPQMVAAIVYEEEKFGAKHALAAFSGTSMASPCVAGIVALWLEANPKLTQKDVMEILRKTSRQPDATFTDKNNYYGWGEIDAYAGILEALALTSSIKDLSTHQPAGIHFRMVGKTLHVAMDEAAQAQLKVYTTSGVLAGEYTLTGNATINLAHLPAGVYALQLNTGNKATTGSTLVRL